MIKKIKTRLIRLIHSNQPSFIISYKYLTKTNDKYIRTHRSILLMNFNRLDLAIVNIFATCRWIVYQAWLSSYKVSKNTSIEKLDKANIKSRYLLFCKLIKLSLLNFIAPHYYFRFQLYKNHPLYFFYSKENSLLHLYSDRFITNAEKYRKLISDKYAFLDFLKQQNIQKKHSQIKTLKQIIESPEIIFRKQKLFCKPNIANRSTGALCIDYKDSEYEIITLVDKTHIKGKSSILNFLKGYYDKNQDILIEEFIEDNKYIKELSKHLIDTTTMRIITASINSTDIYPQAIYAQLEIPLLETNNNRQFYNILPLDIDTLDINLKYMPEFKEKSKFENIKLNTDIKDDIQSAIQKCLKIHNKIDLRAIAFDIILSSKGAIVIEANYNWDIEMLYRASNQKQKNHIINKWLENI